MIDGFIKNRRIKTTKGKAEEVPPLTHDLPLTPRQRRDARRLAALAEANKQVELRHQREEEALKGSK